MHQRIVILAAMLLGTLGVPAVVVAQDSGYQLPHRFNVPASPTVSPYLNLFNGVGDLPNYQTLVRPIIDNTDAIQAQSTQIDRLRRDAGANPARGTKGNPTGHISRYQNFSHYYANGPFTGSR